MLPLDIAVFSWHMPKPSLTALVFPRLFLALLANNFLNLFVSLRPPKLLQPCSNPTQAWCGCTFFSKKTKKELAT